MVTLHSNELEHERGQIEWLGHIGGLQCVPPIRQGLEQNFLGIESHWAKIP